MPDDIPASKYTFTESQLGTGANGSVTLAVVNATGKHVAIKRIPMDKAKANRKQLALEVSCMKKLSHPCLLPLLDVFLTRDALNIVLPNMERGNLLEVVNSFGGNLSDEYKFKVWWQVASGIAHCHANKICHRDIKPENLLIDEFYNAKVSDFGLARVVDESARASTSCGSPEYMAPEVVGTTYDAMKADMWSLGVLLYSMHLLRFPFPGKDLITIHANAKKSEADPSYICFVKEGSIIPTQLPSCFYSLCCLDPEKRSDMATLMRHPFWLESCAQFGLDPAGCHNEIQMANTLQDTNCVLSGRTYDSKARKSTPPPRAQGRVPSPQPDQGGRVQVVDGKQSRPQPKFVHHVEGSRTGCFCGLRRGR